eukprot:GEMP01126483.1.p2 GENE.GEMP01126483.1~~GEMP01126483.1.p2  ORF type:complete len:112 (-),score=9.96 GEMP01126483.1:57-392(-)
METLSTFSILTCTYEAHAEARSGQYRHFFVKRTADCFGTVASSKNLSLIDVNTPSLSKINVEKTTLDCVRHIVKKVQIIPCGHILLPHLSTRSNLVNDGCSGLIQHMELTF